MSSFSDVYLLLKVKSDLKHNIWSHILKTGKVLQPLPPELGHLFIKCLIALGCALEKWAQTYNSTYYSNFLSNTKL